MQKSGDCNYNLRFLYQTTDDYFPSAFLFFSASTIAPVPAPAAAPAAAPINAPLPGFFLLATAPTTAPPPAPINAPFTALLMPFFLGASVVPEEAVVVPEEDEDEEAAGLEPEVCVPEDAGAVPKRASTSSEAACSACKRTNESSKRFCLCSIFISAISPSSSACFCLPPQETMNNNRPVAKNTFFIFFVVS